LGIGLRGLAAGVPAGGADISGGPESGGVEVVCAISVGGTNIAAERQAAKNVPNSTKRMRVAANEILGKANSFTEKLLQEDEAILFHSRDGTANLLQSSFGEVQETESPSLAGPHTKRLPSTQ
jgi:hypothetical protein